MFELSVAAKAKDDIKPRKENDALVLYHPQKEPVVYHREAVHFITCLARI